MLREPAVLRRDAGNGGRGEVPADDGSASDHVPLVRAQAIESLAARHGSSAGSRSRPLGTFSAAIAAICSSEERVALGGDADLLPQLGREVDLGREADEQRFASSALESGSSASASAFGWGAIQVGRCSTSSGRARRV